MLCVGGVDATMPGAIEQPAYAPLLLTEYVQLLRKSFQELRIACWLDGRRLLRERCINGHRLQRA